MKHTEKLKNIFKHEIKLNIYLYYHSLCLTFQLLSAPRAIQNDFFKIYNYFSIGIFNK